jgi:GTP-binding protein Era
MDIEALLDTRVFLELWVKVKRGWRDNKHMLRELGYE